MDALWQRVVPGAIRCESQPAGRRVQGSLQLAYPVLRTA